MQDQLTQPGGLYVPGVQLPSNKEEWLALLTAKTEAHDKAKAELVTVKATIKGLEDSLATASAADKSNLENQITAENGALTFKTAARAMAAGELKMVQAHCDSLGVKRPRKARTVAPAVEDSPEVKEIKAEINRLNGVSDEIRKDKKTVDDALDTARKAHKAAMEGINSRFAENNAATAAQMEKLAEHDPKVKAKLEKAKSGKRGGRRSPFAGKILKVTKKVRQTNPFDDGSAYSKLVGFLMTSEGRQNTYENVRAAGDADNPNNSFANSTVIKLCIQLGHVAVVEAPPATEGDTNQ